MPNPSAPEQNLITGRVRLNFPHLFEVYSFPGDTGDPKYSVMILLPKSDRATLAKLRNAQQAALQAGKDKGLWTDVPKVWSDSIHDGDEEGDLDKSPHLAGHYYINVSSTTRPGVVDQAVQPIMDAGEIYSGCYGRVSLFAFPYKFANKKGVSFILKNVQKLADGDSLGGGFTKAEDEFEAVDMDDNDLI